MGYRCPNGHPTPAEKIVRCGHCRASVVYVPHAVELDLRRQLAGAIVVDDDAIDRLAHLLVEQDESETITLDAAHELVDAYVEALRG